MSVQSALIERIKISLFPLTIECHGVAIVLSERELVVTRDKKADKDLPGERIEKSSNSILDDGLGLMEDIMQGLFSKLSIKGRDILICATLLTGHELCLVTKQISLVSDAKNLAKKVDLDGLSFKITGDDGVEHFRTHPIQAAVLLSQESYSQKEQEPRTVLSFTILQTITLYATEVAISSLQHLVLVIGRWKNAIHVSGEIPEDFSQSLHKVLGLPESINSNSVDIWQTLEDRAMTGNLDDSEVIHCVYFELLLNFYIRIGTSGWQHVDLKGKSSQFDFFLCNVGGRKCDERIGRHNVSYFLFNRKHIARQRRSWTAFGTSAPAHLSSEQLFLTIFDSVAFKILRFIASKDRSQVVL
jgi:hypothetical protein